MSIPLYNPVRVTSSGGLTVSLLAMFFAFSAAADSDMSTCYVNLDPHPCLQTDDPVKACTSSLNENPHDMQTRLSLCGAHLLDKSNAENKIDAYIVVKKGIETCGSDAYVCQRYKYAKSMIEEGDDGSIRKQDISARERCDYGRDLCVSRLTSSLGVRGCDLALICDPEDPTLHAGKGQKLLARGRPAEAVVALQIAAELDATNTDISGRLAEADAARTKLAAECVQGNSLDDCNNALLAGASDEFAVQYRRGQLLVREGQSPAALQAFMSAQSVAPGDEDLARKLLEILEPAIQNAPDDAGYVRSQGLALLAVGDTSAAIIALRRAQQLNPDDDDIPRQLAAARSERADQLQRDCLSRNDAQTCRAMIIAGEPDEARIHAHLATLSRDANDLDAALAEAQTAVRLQPGNAATVALLAEIRELRAPPPQPEPQPEPEPVEVADTEPEPEPEPEPEIVAPADEPEAIIFSNAARQDGRTY